MYQEITLTQNQSLTLIFVLLVLLWLLLRYTGKRTIEVKVKEGRHPENNLAYLEWYGYYIQAASRIND